MAHVDEGRVPTPEDVAACSQRVAPDAAAAEPRPVRARERVPAALVVALPGAAVRYGGAVSAPCEVLVDVDVPAPVGRPGACDGVPTRVHAGAAGGRGRNRSLERNGPGRGFGRNACRIDRCRPADERRLRLAGRSRRLLVLSVPVPVPVARECGRGGKRSRECWRGGVRTAWLPFPLGWPPQRHPDGSVVSSDNQDRS